jgi:tetratricopeptide (TPR) repeat protein
VTARLFVVTSGKPSLLITAHVDAHNHLGVVALELEQVSEARRHFARAVECGERSARRVFGQVAWSCLENRPYLRALGNLAFVEARLGNVEAAREILLLALELDPADGLGAGDLMETLAS